MWVRRDNVRSYHNMWHQILRVRTQWNKPNKRQREFSILRLLPDSRTHTRKQDSNDLFDLFNKMTKKKVIKTTQKKVPNASNTNTTIHSYRSILKGTIEYQTNLTKVNILHRVSIILQILVSKFQPFFLRYKASGNRCHSRFFVVDSHSLLFEEAQRWKVLQKFNFYLFTHSSLPTVRINKLYIKFFNNLNKKVKYQCFRFAFVSFLRCEEVLQQQHVAKFTYRKTVADWACGMTAIRIHSSGPRDNVYVKFATDFRHECGADREENLFFIFPRLLLIIEMTAPSNKQ